jgi:hypothetical protein
MTVPTGFETFWKAYPRRVAKGAAVRAWLKIKPDADVQAQMIAALGWQVQQQSWQEGFIPHPATWLNRWQWEDERPASVVASYGKQTTRLAAALADIKASERMMS